jgi:hypothetical protein
MKDGYYAWLWKLSEIRDFDTVFKQARYLGFEGLHAHSTGSALTQVMNRGLVNRAAKFGIRLMSSVAMDTGTVVKDPKTGKETFVGTPSRRFSDAILKLADLNGPTGAVGFDMETRWDNNRKADALAIATHLKVMNPGYLYWDMPWWEPKYHTGFPYDEIAGPIIDDQNNRILKYRCPQTYPVYSVAMRDANGKKVIDPVTKKVVLVTKFIQVPNRFKGVYRNGIDYMVETANDGYARMNAVPMGYSFQATDGANAVDKWGFALREYKLTHWWHFLRMFQKGNERVLKFFQSARFIREKYPNMSFKDSVMAFQANEKDLKADGWIAQKTIDRVQKYEPLKMPV